MTITTAYLDHAPAKFHGTFVCNEDGSYTIFLDPNDTHERQLEAYMHELEHIVNGDIEAAKSADDCEKERH